MVWRRGRGVRSWTALIVSTWATGACLSVPDATTGTDGSSGTSTSSTTSTSDVTSTSTTTGSPTGSSSTTSTPSTGGPESETTSGGPATRWRQELSAALPGVQLDGALEDVPILIRLTPERFDYETASEGGSDLRFVAQPDDIQALPHEIELWDETGESFVWVRLPTLVANGPTTFWMTYGDTGLMQEPVEEVWSSDYVGVWHFAGPPEAGGFPDSTGNGHFATLSGNGDPMVGPGRIGGGVTLDGMQSLSIEDDAQFNLDALTISSWVQPEDITPVPMASRVVLSRNPSYRLAAVNPNGFPTATVEGVSGATQVAASVPLGTNEWSYVAGTFDGQTLGLFLGDQLVDSSPAEPPTSSLDAPRIGNRFIGTLDEVRVSSVPRSEDWILVQVASTRDNLVTFGTPEPW